MIMKNIVIICTCLALISLLSCNPQRQIAGHYSYETECLGSELDGSQTVRAWGTGRNRGDAIEQAKKNVIREVLFKGIRNGKPECHVRPVIVEVNAHEKYEDYFFNFFRDEGPYSEFIIDDDGSDLHLSVIKGRKKAGDQETYGVVVRVHRARLKERMMSDNIISK